MLLLRKKKTFASFKHAPQTTELPTSFICVFSPILLAYLVNHPDPFTLGRMTSFSNPIYRKPKTFSKLLKPSYY